MHFWVKLLWQDDMQIRVLCTADRANKWTDNINIHDHSSPKMSANLELKTSHYRDAEHVYYMYYNGYSLDLLIFLVVHILAYMPRSFSRDAVSAATGSGGDGSISPQGFPWGMLATADGATHPHQSLSYWQPLFLRESGLMSRVGVVRKGARRFIC